MKPTYIVIGIAVIAAIAGVAVLSASGPDFDAIIANKDCNAAGKLTDADSAKATAQQSIQIGALLTACLISGGNP
ncbi:MAG: hypothetical protein EB829_00775 [Nitrosopumilus sp. H8]|nr:MAG: hypothetical protein EB829_00775 [Nitrosopumilus sp. H8]